MDNSKESLTYRLTANKLPNGLNIDLLVKGFLHGEVCASYSYRTVLTDFPSSTGPLTVHLEKEENYKFDPIDMEIQVFFNLENDSQFVLKYNMTPNMDEMATIVS